jgi:hypothetical protein
MKRLTIYTFFLFAFCSFGWSQKVKTVEYTYVYHPSHNESMEQAKRNAVNRAKVEALRENFGTVVSGASATSIISKNNITESRFVHLGSEGELNGEWIADIEEPKVVPSLEGGVIYLTATVKGKAREVVNNTIAFEAKILRNKPDVSFESSEFTAGNNIYVSFTSPVDGFLTIYLLDGETAYCLLPYAGNKEGVQTIVHGREYKFFSRKVYAEDENPDIIDEYTLTTEGNHQDLNQLYFIFSPQKFSKALDRFKSSTDGTLFPRMLSWEDFQKWILKARRADKDMCVQTKYITISPRR